MQSEMRTKGERLAGSTGQAAGSSPARPLQSLTIPIDEVAELLGRDVDGVKRRYRQLLAAGFPRRLPGSDWRFSRALVRVWVNSHGALQAANDDQVHAGRTGDRAGGISGLPADSSTERSPPPVALSIVDLQHEHLSRKYGGERA